MIADLEGEENKSASVLLVTIWELGEAAGPLLIAPLSEVYGRYLVFNCANILFICWTALAAISQNSSFLIFTRFLTGCAVASNVLNPAIIGDVVRMEERGSAMSILMLAPLLGGAVGPAISGAIAQSLGWRAILWMAALLAGVCELVFLTMLRETYKVRILRRRAKRLRNETNNSSLKTEFDTESESTSLAVWESIKRPMTVLFSSFVLQALSLYGAVVFSFFYVMSTTLPDILQNIYDFDPAMTGSSFLTFSEQFFSCVALVIMLIMLGVGSSVGILICNFSIDRLYIKLRDANNGVSQPEHRLPLAVVSAFCLPASVTLYGWVAQNHWPVAFVLIATSLLGFSLLLGIVPLMAYVVDAFGLYSASAMTAVLITRCLSSTFLPLTTGPLVNVLGYGFGFLVLAGVCLAVMPIPFIVMRYGSRWRQRCEYTSDT